MASLCQEQKASLSKQISITGLSSAGIFIAAFFLFSTLTPEFDLINDYISRLGARNQPLALWWNLSGFILVGVLFSVFGWNLGRLINDPLAGICLVLSGIGFSLAAMPADFAHALTPLSKAHFVSICMALAGWCLGLARMGRKGSVAPVVRSSANTAGVLAILPMAGAAIELITAPLAHRLVLIVVFGWVIFVSLRLLTSPNTSMSGKQGPAMP